MLVKVLRPYSGLEGRRVRKGVELFVTTTSEDPPEGAIAISPARYRELERVGLVEPGKLASEKPSTRKPGRATPPAKPVTNKVAAARRQAANNTSGPKDPTGIKIGRRNAPSSSVVVPASEDVTSKRPGKRGERAGSPSTTPIASSADQTSSTPPTPPGGDSTDPTSNNQPEPPLG